MQPLIDAMCRLLRAQRAEEARPAEPPAVEKLEKDALVARVKACSRLAGSGALTELLTGIRSIASSFKIRGELPVGSQTSTLVLQSKHGSSQLNECQKQLVIETAEARNAKRRSVCK